MRALAVVLAAGMVWLLSSVICCAVFIRTARYTIVLPGMTTPVRAMVLSDLHGRMFGRGHFTLGERMELLITSGLAGYGWLPRVNNLPEIAVVELVPQNDS